MKQIEARAEALQERVAKHGTHDQEDHGGKNKRPRPMPTTPAPEMPTTPVPEGDNPRRPKKPAPEMQAPERRNPKPTPTTPDVPARPKKPKPDKTLPRNPNSPSPEEQALDRLKQEMEEKKKKEEDALRRIKEQQGQVKKAEHGIKLGSMVTWGSSGGTAKGKVTRITKGSINVPDSSFTIKGEEDNPAVLIRIYKDGKPTDKLVGHKMNTLRKA